MTSAERFTLALAGDVMLGRLMNEVISQQGFAYPWGDTLPMLRQVDRFLINLECALTAETERWLYPNGQEKTFYFRADPAVVETLRIGRVDFAGIANNHIGDFGDTGLLETLSVLDQAGIARAGAGENLTGARTPASLDIKGQRIKIIAFADYPEEWAATYTSPGINYIPITLGPEGFGQIELAVLTAREEADLVIVCAHWGPNMLARPTETFKSFARQVVDVGADIFWGHSAHVVQGVEIRNGKLILFDTGDFVDDYAVDPILRNDLSALFLVQVRPPVIERLTLVPVHIDNMQVNFATGAERDRLIQQAMALSSELGTELQSDGRQLHLDIAPA